MTRRFLRAPTGVVVRAVLPSALRAAAAAAVAAPATVGAQQAAAAPCAGSEHRRFDFWAGSWTVTDSAGARTFGRNTITIMEGGCVLHERWTSAATPPSTGQSLNANDRTTRQWGQTWVGNDGLVLHLRGGLERGRMGLAGDGRVRQLGESSRDGGITWAVAFDGWYRRTP
jgi:hypothetical protein